MAAKKNPCGGKKKKSPKKAPPKPKSRKRMIA